MDEKRFELLLGQIGDLTPAQFKELVKSYAGQSGQDAKRVWEKSVYVASEQHLADLGVNHACPGCGSVAVVHNGLTDAGVQRFHCQDCGKNFTRFTGALLRMNRSIQAEGAFGGIKWNRSYTRARRRGLDGLLLETALISCGFNLHKFHLKSLADQLAA